MMDFDISDFDRGSLAMLSGFGFVSLVLFFYFFMLESGMQAYYVVTTLVILFASLAAIFYVFEDLNAIFDLSLSRPDPDGFRKNVKRASNFISGMLLMGLVGFNLIVYTESIDSENDLGIAWKLICIT
ncbi:MAG: hypothetical protein QCI38_08785, partial [Candidatus Thermoplasmatota archaeon]|nr:hypothetical protein [Candidatus Thermoplasmatota archaeon]